MNVQTCSRLIASLTIAAAALFGPTCARADGTAFTVVRVDVWKEDLRIYWKNDENVPLRRFDRLSSWLDGQGKTLTFAMNAGMYHADASPVGLLVVAGRTLSPLNVADGTGNFFLKPNGVFLVAQRTPRVVQAADYPGTAQDVSYATQSGPMLVIGGKINPAFSPASTSRLIRNGVCAIGRTAVFAISEKPVNLHEFATFFKNELKCDDALYLDGVVSSLYSRDLGRSDRRANLGPLFAVVR